jgi:hypothetical protein
LEAWANYYEINRICKTGVVEWRKKKGEIHMKKLLITLLSAVILFSATPVMAASFNDVSDDSWAAPAISFMADKQVVNGYEDGTFKPENPVTKAEFAHMFHKLFPEVKITSDYYMVTYADTKGHWAEKDISTLLCSGEYAWIYTDHYTKDGKSCLAPDKQLTRLDVAILISVLTKDMRDPQDESVEVIIRELSKYRDIKIKPRPASGPWFADMSDPTILTDKDQRGTHFSGDVEQVKAEYIYSAIHNEVLVGANGLFRPKDKVTRAEAATILYRVYNQLNQ